ncbi:MAG: two pore domain potassium channel family protein, partial [Deltaproteobacteria bacterium]|nr:two pore domain potassium channel family protein [Deltaproteobacteria bacterium]
ATILRIVNPEADLILDKASFTRLVDFLYFSVITCTTVGYGDILPNSTLTRFIVIT